MPWIYVPGLEAPPSDSEEWAFDPCVTSSGTLLPRPSSWRGWRTRPWIARLSGTISRPSTAARGVVSWISSLRASRASPTPSPAAAKATTTRELSGRISSASSRSVSPPASSLRTSPGFSRSPGLDFGESFEAWASSGLRHTTRRPRTTAPRTTDTGSFSSLPTPSASSYGYNQGGAAGRTGHQRPLLRTLVKGLPSPTARDWKDSPGMAAEAPGRKREDHLPRVIHGLPTPTAGDAKASGAAGYSTSSGRHSGTTLTDVVTGAASSGRRGKLNPRFVEWMMGLPPGFSDPTDSEG